MPGVPRGTVLRLYDEGVDAVVAAAGALGPGGWSRVPPAATWTASDLARHVLAVAQWYERWLDRAERGDAAPPFGVSELAARNTAELEELRALDGPEAVTRFAATARAYRARLPSGWDLPFGYPRRHGHRRAARGDGGLRVAPARLGPGARRGAGVPAVRSRRALPPPPAHASPPPRAASRGG